MLGEFILPTKSTQTAYGESLECKLCWQHFFIFCLIFHHHDQLEQYDIINNLLYCVQILILYIIYDIIYIYNITSTGRSRESAVSPMQLTAQLSGVQSLDDMIKKEYYKIYTIPNRIRLPSIITKGDIIMF